MGWFNSLADDIKHAAETVASKVESTAETVAKTVENTGSTVINKIEDAGKDAAGAVKNAAEDTWSFTKNTTSVVAGALETAWEATSQETKDIAGAVEGAGIKIGQGFMDGANVAMQAVEEGAETVGTGLVEAGKYLSRHLCDIGVGSALSAVFAALAADGEEEAAVGSIAGIAAMQTIDNVELNTAASTLASIIATPVSAIPGVSSVVSKDELTSIIAFLIFKAVKQNPKVVVGTAGQYLAGALIYGLTSLICEGEIPGGYQVWKGAQNAA